jgi:XTP/dITP diphosphohydrolase
VSLREVPGVGLPPETGETFEENARIKARAAAKLSGMPALADDSGLCVDWLNGLPGVHSARYAGDAADAAANRKKLLAELKGVPPAHRTARFVCVLCFAMPSGEEAIARGECSGHLLDAERGTGGFGYDALFVPDGHSRTFAEMSTEEKDPLSHRGRAIRLARERLASWLSREVG